MKQIISNELTYWINSASPNFDNNPSTLQLRIRTFFFFFFFFFCATHWLCCCVRQSDDRAACTAVSSGLARPPLHSLPLMGPETSRHWCRCLWNNVSMRTCVCSPSDIIGLSSLLLCVCSLVLGRCPAGTGEDSATRSGCSSAPVSSR